MENVKYRVIVCKTIKSFFSKSKKKMIKAKAAFLINIIKNQTNAEVSPSQIILKSELNKIGLYKVDVNFHSEVKANISVKIDKIQTK